MNKPQLLFVYNADSRWFNMITEFAHKMFSPSTYQCRLCAITYGNFSMKQSWKNFLEKLPVKAEFLYKDEFKKQYPVNAEFPVIFLKTNGTLKTFLSKEEIEKCTGLDQLMILVTNKLSIHDQHHHTNI